MPNHSFTGEAFLKGAFSERAATVLIQAGEGDGSLVACLARGLNVQYVTAKLQVNKMSAREIHVPFYVEVLLP